MHWPALNKTSFLRGAPWLIACAIVLTTVGVVYRLPPSILSTPQKNSAGKMVYVKSEVTAKGADGRVYVMNGDYDVYAWARPARRLLETGDPCEARVNGQCFDTKLVARGGVHSPYAEDLHVYAIAAFAKVAQWANRSLPFGSAAKGVAWIAVLIGTLAIFIFGARQGGLPGAIAASFFPALHPIFMRRAINGDNDCWHFALPMLAAVALSESFNAKDTKRISVFAVLSGVAMGLEAWAWSGWIFFQSVFLSTLTLTAIWQVCRGHGFKDSALRISAYLVPCYLGAWLGGADRPFFPLPSTEATYTFFTLPWPNAIATVGEAQSTKLADTLRVVGSWPGLVAALLGVAWAFVHGWREKSEREGALAIPLLVGTWIVGGLVLGAHALRHLSLLPAPIALGWALLAGSLAQALRTKTRHATAVVCTLAALPQILFIQTGVKKVRSFEPRLTQAWWNTLAQIDLRAAPDAVIHTWWDYGSWSAYFTKRRVSATGSTLRTHAVFWLSRAFLAPPRESVGILRMLNCSGDALPFKEGETGALGLTIRATGDQLQGYQLLRRILPLDREPARQEIIAAGISEADAQNILQATHCHAGEAWLVLSSDDLKKAWSWSKLGAYDVAAAALAKERGELQKYKPPPERFMMLTPMPCAIDTEGTLLCQSPRKTVQVSVPTSGYSLVRVSKNQSTVRPGVPPIVVRIDETGRNEITTAAGKSSDYSLFLDKLNRRAWLMTPALVRSTAVELLLLPEPASPYFEKVSSHLAWNGERVSAFRVHWPEP